jgi:hypothetical protein
VDACLNVSNACEIQNIPTESYGFTVNCDGIAACEQSTFTTYVIGVPKDVTFSFSPATISPGTWSVSTITVASTEKPGLMPETFGFTTASGSWQSGPNITLPTQILCSLAVVNACPKLNIVDQNLSGAPVVSGSPPPKQQTVVGRQASLQVQVNGTAGSGAYSLSNPTWTIPGSTEKDYEFNGATPQPIASTDLTSSQLAFFWYVAQDNRPSVTATLTRSDSNEIAYPQAQADYNVQTPTAKAYLAQHPGRTNTGTRSDGNGKYYLSCGNPEDPCINFSFSISNNVGFPGIIAMNQLIVQSRSYTNSNGVVTSDQWGPPPELDNGPLPEYVPAVTTGATWTALDAPGIGLLNTYVTATTSYTFSDTFMYQASDHGFWVPLQAGTWGWSAGATITNVTSNLWCVDGTIVSGGTLCPGSAATITAATPSATQSFPSWTATYQNSTSYQRKVGSKRPHTTPLLSAP